MPLTRISLGTAWRPAEFAQLSALFHEWGSRDFPSKNDKVLWRPRRLWPPEGYYFFRDPYLGSV